MSPEDTAFLAMWEPHRQKSRRRYVTTCGVLGWGVPFWLLFCAFHRVWDPEKVTVAFVIFNGATSALMGMIYGLFYWDKNETRYRSLTSRKAGADPAH